MFPVLLFRIPPCSRGALCWCRCAEIAPEVMHPLLKRSVRELLNTLPKTTGEVRKLV